MLAVACGGSSPTTPTSTAISNPAVTTPTPAPIPRADVELASQTLTFSCVTGLCTSLTFPIINRGPGCATNIVVTTRAFGSDGNGIQLGVDIPMYAPGFSLPSGIMKSGITLPLLNVSSFNDVRSAHTVFKTNITFNSVACN